MKRKVSYMPLCIVSAALTLSKSETAELKRRTNTIIYRALLILKHRPLWKDGQKRGIMYAWAFSICGFTIFGRTWEQYYDMLADIQRILKLSEDRRLVVYVHNLAWEFQVSAPPGALGQRVCY